MQSFDVVIAGGGMVGLSVAALLAESGLRIAVLESQSAPSDNLPACPETRVSAINAASERLLQKLGVWSDILSMRASPYQGMEVWEHDSFGRIVFQAQEQGYSHLGHIVENGSIQRALWQKVARQKSAMLIPNAVLQQVAWGEKEVFLTLENGQMMTARLLIGADGAHSWLRQQANIPQTFWDYGHHALVATIRTAESHGGYARQIFYPEGILAFLPLADSHLCSIVWAVSAQYAQHLKALSRQEFNQVLSITFDNRLGLCQLDSERHVFPLMGRYAHHFASQRLALVGDAAHTIHPLAGQGANLGFMDTVVLAEEICRLQREGKDIGSYMYLRRYERNRKHSAVLMLAAMQGFRQLFDGHHPAKKIVRDVGLTLANRLPGLKPRLIQHAMGLVDLPDSLR